MLTGSYNPAFTEDTSAPHSTQSYDNHVNNNNNGHTPTYHPNHGKISLESIVHMAHIDRDEWGKGIEFLMSCIAMSVGLGNVWRFPLTALENGGGAFVIPYIIVLFLIGKPVYFMEMILGQFSGRGSVKVFDFAPAMRGVAIGQVISVGFVITYYSSIMALTLRYFFASFSSILPWSVCHESYGCNCVPSGAENVTEYLTKNNETRSSAELYFM